MLNFSMSGEYERTLESLSDKIKERYQGKDPEQAEQLLKFARQLYASSPIEELASKRVENLYGATLALWNFVARSPKGEYSLRVYNPRFEDHGWQSTHTIVELIGLDRAFVVDSVMMEFNRRGMIIHSVTNAVFATERDDKGNLMGFDSLEEGAHTEKDAEAVLHLEVDKESDPAVIADIEQHLHSILRELTFVVGDFPSMLDATLEMANNLLPGHDDSISCVDIKAFMHWLADNHLTFLGIQEYVLTQEQGQQVFVAKPDTALGVVRHDSTIDLMESNQPVQFPEKALLFSKSGTKARVHRPAYMDFIGVRQFNDKGELIGEFRLLGLYTSQVFNNSPRHFPIIATKIADVIRASRLDPSGHDGKRLAQILETIPRQELFQTEIDELLATAVGILQIQERRRLRLFVRKGQLGRFVSCLIYTPRDSYSTNLRHRFQTVICEYVDALDLEFDTYFTETTLARLYIVIRVKDSSAINFDVKEVEERLIRLARSWQDRLQETLVEAMGEEKAGEMLKRYGSAFSMSYQEDITTRTAVSDVEHMESLNGPEDISVAFYKPLEASADALNFKIFRREHQIPLSDVMPMLENLGLRVLGGRPYHIETRDGPVWIYDFSVKYQGVGVIDIDAVKGKLQDAFDQIWHGHAENDSFNRLVLGIGLDWREVTVLRAYAKYFKQTGFSFSQEYIKDALVNNPDISRQLIEYFYARFNPDNALEKEALADLRQEITANLDHVKSLDEDRILRRYVDMMSGTWRTNFFQQNAAGDYKDYVSFKLSPKEIPDLPKPLPEYEIFVYSPAVEGVHLRGGKVARGGLRWSDRREDFRTEVLGLVKAQQVKNAVIVPVGAKGGFVPKRLPKEGSRDEVVSEAISCYKTFIRGLLDITDNLIEGEVVPPQQVVRHDTDDPYLVVAADKGTATFSDIANAIADEYNFWLGDAFASGGSVGYDHKKMGITAKGAWVSVQRHFREMGINVQETPFTVLGIGDMSGDVFGNGMLLSRKIQLCAAFNHLHIFIDPDPDCEQSFLERERMFNLPRSTWSDYNAELISSGGGVFSRSAKSIPISREMKARFAIEANQLTPNELLTALLKAPLDLIWNGGIGTYIKAESELNADVGDKANDNIRVNGSEVNARVIGEGGNLGCTQLGRIEYGLKGGLSNTDFIDNAGGVDCSDHEVNIKILLNDIVGNGDMTLKQRNHLLAEMTEEVSDLVLKNNYRQVQALSLAKTESVHRMSEYKRYINSLVAAGKLDRELEFIPGDELLHERLVNDLGLVRPELSTLLSYTKALLKDELSDAALIEDDYVRRDIMRPFPEVLVERFGSEIENHKLAKEIIATQVANDIANYMGITFVYRMHDSAGSSTVDIAKAFIAARDIFRLEYWWQQIEALDHKVDANVQLEMMRALIRMVRRATRWLLRNNRRGVDIERMVERYRPGIKAITDTFDYVLKGQRAEAWERQNQRYLDQGVPRELAVFIAGTESMQSALGVIQAAELTEEPVEVVAMTFFELGHCLDLYWFMQEINALRVENHWQALSREAFRDDLEWQQRALTVGVLQLPEHIAGNTVESRVAAWSEHHGDLVSRWRNLISEFRAIDVKELAMYGVALRELMDIAQTTLHTELDTSHNEALDENE